MMRMMTRFLSVFLCLFTLMVFAQENRTTNREFELKGSVKVKETRTPINNVEVYISGGRGTYTDASGDFRLRASIGDELVVAHPDFITVYYTIKSEERVDVLVEGFEESEADTDDASTKGVAKDEAKIEREQVSEAPAPSRNKKRKTSVNQHQVFLDSANFYKKTDIDKSILFVENSLKSLGKRGNKTKSALSYATLGDVYLHWNQYDLAITNYESSLRLRKNTDVRLKLAKAYFLNKEFESSKTEFETVLGQRTLNDYQRVSAFEGLGDVNKAMGNNNLATSNYRQGLQIAEGSLITPKITDLNSKLGENFSEQGQIQQAQDYFSNSINLAANENAKRSVQEKTKVADFYNSNQQYDDEIRLRKETLETVEQLGFSDKTYAVSPFVTDSITPQKINYKIGNAYSLKRDFDNAIPYLEKSISEADSKEDLVVQKDATRRLSEVLSAMGLSDKALETYEDYVNIVDKLYVKKEQEISQATRFSREIATKQNRITSLEKDRELSESRMDLITTEQELTSASNRKQQIAIYSLIIGMLLLAAAIFFMRRGMKQQKLANNLLALKSLRSQMNPHFIFNALNSVNSYIALNDERNANRYLSEFSVLMRSVLENSEEDFIPLGKEIELLELYVKLEHSRFKDKFDYEVKIDEDVAVGDFEIPPMLLQPYIENAIWHGLRYKETKGTLLVHMKQEDKDTVKVVIEDDGIGRKRSAELKTQNQLKQKSKGMSNIKKRVQILNEMYQGKVDVFVEDVQTDGQGTKVVLTLKKD